MKRVLIASALLALTSLGAGCGLKGGLDRPAPMWGPERARYLAAEKQAEADRIAAKKAQRPHVDIPVEGDGTTAAQATPSASQATAGTGTSASVTKDGEPDLKKSGGAVPPVDNMARQPSSY